MKKIEINEMPILVKMEKFYNDCYDTRFGTFDFELFGERVFNYLANLGLKKFNSLPNKK